MDEQSDPTGQQEDARRTPLWRRIGLRLFGLLASAVVRGIGATWRVSVLGEDPRAGRSPDSTPAVHVAALFHESLLTAAHFFRDHGYAVAISRSRDGDLIAAALRGLGFGESTRGSSSQGGASALRGLMRQIEAGQTVSVLVDGPRGPARVSKTGIVALARLTGLPIQPVAFSARPAIRLGSWDRGLVPLPFARVVCAFGEPIVVDSELDLQGEQSLARTLDRRLGDLHHAADRLLLDARTDS
jgi:lysophospholipid acyltransferase (LPLAT)-like uncharacterized protein